MAKKFVIDTCFSETETIKSILNFDKKRMTVFKRHLGNRSYQVYYSLLVKYLLSLNSLSIEEIKKVVRRHIAISTYLVVREKIPKKPDLIFRFNDIERVITDHELNLESLLKKESLGSFNPFSCLFNDEDYEDIKRDIVCISSWYDVFTKGENRIDGLLNNVIDYFGYACKFADLKYLNHGDLIVAHSLIGEKLRDFTFTCNDDSIKKYWISNVVFKEEDIIEKMFGHIINIIMLNENYDFAKTMIIMPPYYYEIMLCYAQKKLIQSTFSFISVNVKNNTAVVKSEIIKDDIIFTYNDEKYVFSSKGIQKAK